MTCQSCADGITGVLGKIDGVSAAEVDHVGGTAAITFDPGAVSCQQLESAITSLGYKVEDPAPETASSCGAPAGHAVAPAGHAVAPASTLAAEDLARVVDFVVNRLTAADPPALPSPEEVERATGVKWADHLPTIGAAVTQRLEKEHPAILAVLAGESRCAQHDACSLHGDLSSASGDTQASTRGRRRRTAGPSPASSFPPSTRAPSPETRCRRPTSPANRPSSRSSPPTAVTRPTRCRSSRTCRRRTPKGVCAS
jgi:copper chaperone CopZ